MSLLARGAVALGTFALLVGSVVTATSASAEPVATAPTPDAVTGLALTNGWTAYGTGTRTPTATRASGIVILKGAMRTSGTNSLAFTLPPGYRPTANVYLPVDLCNATNGRLLIETDGSTFVQAPTFSNAQCFTSLDGVAFPVATAGFTALGPINGWTGAPFGTRDPGVKLINNKVWFKGSVSTSGTNSSPFVIPVGFRPKTVVYLKVDMCNATNGRLIIAPDGTVSVEAETDFSNAQCFTSLEGVSYATGSNNYAALPLINGWTGAGFSTRSPALRSFNGNISLQGSMETTGTSTAPFVIPAGFRPSGTIYVPVDMCGATNGRLIIGANGSVSVAAETDFSNAQCFVSLEGVVWRKP